jgi:methionine synthase II (cobalamin-independent)
VFDRPMPGRDTQGEYSMIFSRDRILTTHVGSLPRNVKLSDLLLRQEAGEKFDPNEMAAELDRAVRHVVDKQAAAGIDIGNDGEQQRVGFQTYVPQRMSGFGGVSASSRTRRSARANCTISTSSRSRMSSRASRRSPATSSARPS